MVDDDEEYLLYMQSALRAAGYAAVSCSSAYAAKKTLEQQGFDLIVTDMVMPGMNGIELLDWVREKHPLTVGIVTTAHGSVESALEALKKGAFDYLLKPSAADVIQAAVARGLKQNKLKRKLLERTGQVEKLKDECKDAVKMIRHISHKLKNPLAVVYGYSTYFSGMGLDTFDRDEIKKGISTIRRNAELMQKMLDDLHNSPEEKLKSEALASVEGSK